MSGFVAIDALLGAVRDGLDRVEPADLTTEVAAGALVVDIRPIEQRERDGELPDALIIDRNVLEWRLDPTCPHHIPEVFDPNYVAGGEENTSGYVSVVDTLHCRATDVTSCQASWPKIPTGRGTFGVTLDPSTKTIFTTNVLDASMNIVDVRHCNASDHSQCAATSPRIAIGIFPVASAADPGRNTLYASNLADRTESIINLRRPCAQRLCFR